MRTKLTVATAIAGSLLVTCLISGSAQATSVPVLKSNATPGIVTLVGHGGGELDGIADGVEGVHPRRDPHPARGEIGDPEELAHAQALGVHQQGGERRPRRDGGGDPLAGAARRAARRSVPWHGGWVLAVLRPTKRSGRGCRCAAAHSRSLKEMRRARRDRKLPPARAGAVKDVPLARAPERSQLGGRRPGSCGIPGKSARQLPSANVPEGLSHG